MEVLDDLDDLFVDLDNTNNDDEETDDDNEFYKDKPMTKNTKPISTTTGSSSVRRTATTTSSSSSDSSSGSGKFKRGDTINVEILKYGRLGASVDVIGDKGTYHCHHYY